MDNSTILVVLSHETDDQFIDKVARSLTTHNVHITCLLLTPGVHLPVTIYGVAPYGGVQVSEEWKRQLDEKLAQQKKRVDEIEQILARAGASGDVQALLSSGVETSDQIARRARVCDQTVLAPDLKNMPQLMNDAAHGVLYKSASGMMMNGVPGTDFHRIFVSWDSSSAAASAVRAALPFLDFADDVIIACFDLKASEEFGGADPGTDVAAWLSHHGCNVTLSQYSSGGREIAQCIQDRAKELGADLVVMGAYGHSRMLQTVFGGTTRTMLEQTELPVLMAH